MVSQWILLTLYLTSLLVVSHCSIAGLTMSIGGWPTYFIFHRRWIFALIRETKLHDPDRQLARLICQPARCYGYESDLVPILASLICWHHVDYKSYYPVINFVVPIDLGALSEISESEKYSSILSCQQCKI